MRSWRLASMAGMADMESGFVKAVRSTYTYRYQRKYMPGERLTSMDEICNSEFIYMNDKIKHRGFFMSMQLMTLWNMARAGRIKRAIRIRSDQRKDIAI